jgi:outer membrane protein
MLFARPIGVVACTLALLCARAEADDVYTPPDFMGATPPLPTFIDAAAVWKLDLAEALQLAVRNNLNISLERKSVVVADLGIDVAGGTYEPTVTASVNHSSADTPPTTAQGGAADQNFTTVSDLWSLGATERLTTGTQLGISYGTTRTKSSLGTAVEPLNYYSSVTLSVTQPLLHGFSTDLVIPRLPLLTAHIASERERRQLAIAATDVIERTEDAYWDVTQALYTYDLELRSAKRAEDQLALTKRQIEAGLLAPSDLIAAESTLAQRQLRLVQAEDAIGQSWDALRAILNLPRDQWVRPILPVEVPKFTPEVQSSDAALAIAMKRRPELAQSELDLESAELGIRRADNDKLPEIDVGVTGSVVGQDASYGPTLHQLGAIDASGWSVFMNLTWTPLRRASTAAAEISRINQTMAVSRRDQLVQAIWLAVRDAIRNQKSAGRQVIAAAKSRQLAELNLEIEQRKFLNGTSNNIFVAGRQEELASAQLSELGAVLGHKKATAAVLRATGQLLEARSIRLDAK